MPDADQIRDAMIRYVKLLCDGDVAGIMAMFAADPRVEDPVGGPLLQGREAVEGFYALATPRLRAEITGPIRVAGNECAMPMRAEIDHGDRKSYIDVIDVMRFDAEGKVESMRAFWNPNEMRDAP